MTDRPRIERRRFLERAAGGAGALALGGCDKHGNSVWLSQVLDSAEALNRRIQPAITPAGAKGRQYTEADLSRHFKSNGTHYPDNPEYRELAGDNFVDWRLELGGLVDHPMRLSLAGLRSLPSVTQITRHDCVEGWSCIGKWTGVPLRTVLAPLGVQSHARYVMFFCYDRLAMPNRTGAAKRERYYESIDLEEARHPQTILAYAMNDVTLPIPHGAPLRLRLGRQLGYKMPKYLKRIELVEDFSHIEGGHGGLYEDNGYEWYAGI